MVTQTWRERDQLALDWLLEPDAPGVRYLALRDLVRLPTHHPDLQSACAEAHATGPIASVLSAMQREGYWVESGAGYYPKYRSTVWAITLLAQLGASAEHDQRVRRGCRYVLEHSLTASGQFTMSGAPSGTVDCLQGNLCEALLALGTDPRALEPAYEWMARTVTGDGLAAASDRSAARRYYAAKCGPLFACGANGGLPCAWGAAKVMAALARWPAERHAPPIARAIEEGAGFLFSVDPATAEYPHAGAPHPSRNWWKLGFPVFYVTDLLQIVQVLGDLGYGSDARLSNTVALMRDKQDQDGRWALEYDYGDKTWGDFGSKRQPNKWVTLRALRALRRSDA